MRGRKRTLREVDIASDMRIPAGPANAKRTSATELQPAGVCSQPLIRQQTIWAALHQTAKQTTDEYLGELSYGNNRPFRLVESPEFKNFFYLIKGKTFGYKLPTREALAGRILDATVKRIRKAKTPLREAVCAQNGTVVVDGLDTIHRDHLVNILMGSARGFNFQRAPSSSAATTTRTPRRSRASSWTACTMQ
eukprot:4673914-Pleurochrysis_carterae.AAC.1